MKDLEVQGGEMSIQNANGDVAVIPVNKVPYIKSLIKQGKFEQVDQFISLLPKNATYAKFGTVNPEEKPKKKSHKELIDIYGKGIHNRQIYIDLWDKKLPATNIDYQRWLRTDTVNPKHQQYKDAYMALYKTMEDTERKFNEDWDAKHELNKIMGSNSPYDIKYSTKEHAHDQGDMKYWNARSKLLRPHYDQLQQIQNAYEKEVGTKIIAENPETSWKEVFANNPQIKGGDRELLFASLMDEGGDVFTDRYKGGYQTNLYDGFANFGLDTFGSRLDEFVKKGYIKSDIKDRVGFGSTYNEKKEKVHYANFSNLDDVLKAKYAFMQSSKSNTLRMAKKLGIDLTDTEAYGDALEFFTLVGFNAGEGNAQKMMQSYFDKGLLTKDKLLEGDGENWLKPHSYAKRRIEATKMLRGEKTINP